MCSNETEERMLPIDGLVHQQIEETYLRVFANKDEFNGYFFSTPDVAETDLLVRLGVVIKRLFEPAERFELTKDPTNYLVFPDNSIHRLGMSHGSKTLELNLYTIGQISTANEINENKPQTNNPNFSEAGGESNSNLIYLHPKLELSECDIQNVLSQVLPDNSTINVREKKDEKILTIKTDFLDFYVYVWNHEIIGNHISLGFPREPVKIDDSLMSEYRRYHENMILPAQLKNAIESLYPTRISRELKELTEKRRSNFVVERMFLTPNIWEVSSSGKIAGKEQYFGWGRIIDLEFLYAKDFGFLPEDMDWSHNYNPGGWFQTVEQVWHSLFNTPFSGEIEISDINSSDNSIEIRPGYTSDTHQRVIKILHVDKKDEVEEFTTIARDVINGYRSFTTNDLQFFKLPEGYQPIAVSKLEDFAIGFRQLRSGVELCFQIHSKQILGQIEKLSEKKEILIQQLNEEKKALDDLHEKYT